MEPAQDTIPEEQLIAYNELYGERPEEPDTEYEIVDAKAFLQKPSFDTGDNLYDHLTDVLNKILAERPENIVDFFEEYSRKVKEIRYRPLTDHLNDIYVPPDHYELSQKLLPLLKPQPKKEEGDVEAEPMEDEEDAPKIKPPTIWESLYFFEQVGIGLPRAEIFCVALAVKKLQQSQPIKNVRFWGKLFGLEKNYLVVEAEYNDEELAKLLEQIEAEEAAKEEERLRLEEEERVRKEEEEAAKAEALGEDAEPKPKVPRELPPLPVSTFVPTPEAPVEKIGEGVNKRIYFVCHEAGDEWIQLPELTPQHIQVSRQIVKYLTGNLDQVIESWPHFPGTEREYLRAQIARISAGTQVSPLGFYKFGAGGGDEEEEEVVEEEEEGAPERPINPNARFEPVPIKDLTDGTMSFWAHHTTYILPQGRTKWWNPSGKKGEGEEEEMGEEEEEEKGPVYEPEKGPRLLTPLSEDASLEAIPPWSTRTSTQLLTDEAIVLIRSNLWPGAFCYVAGKKFENIYVGWGHKHNAYNYTPPPIYPIQFEYPLGPEIMEINDATAAQEEEWRIAHEPKPPLMSEGGEEGGEEEEEEEDD